jgi:electron transfer flavoprotein beta subunit
MKLICLVKFVPDVGSAKYDFERHTLIRDGAHLQLNPDDVCAVAFALRIKTGYPETIVEVVTMASAKVTPNIEDLLRVGVDRSVILSDPAFAGSDTFATARVLARYLSRQDFSVLMTGTHSIDGDTSHIPAQLGAALNLAQMSGIQKIDETLFSQGIARFDVESEQEINTYQMRMPCILSLTRESGYKLPYASRANLEKDFSSKIQLVTNQDLGFLPNEVGLQGSKTRVVETYVKRIEKREQSAVRVDENGVEYVLSFLTDKGFI